MSPVSSPSHLRFLRMSAAVWLCVLACACSDSAPTGSGVRMSAAQDQSITIDFKVNPDPPRSGDNTVNVVVRNADGTAVTDAAVTATFYMPAMPSMNMPEMRDVFQLSHTQEGTYSGRGNLEMAGTWDVTVNVSRSGEPLAKGRSTVIAK